MSNRFEDLLTEELNIQPEAAKPRLPHPSTLVAPKAVQVVPPPIPEDEPYNRFDLDVFDEPAAEQHRVELPTIEAVSSEPFALTAQVVEAPTPPVKATKRTKNGLLYPTATEALFAAGPCVFAKTDLDPIPFDDSPNAKLFRAARNSVTKHIYGFVSSGRYGALQNETLAELLDSAFPDIKNWKLRHTPFGERCWWEAPVDCMDYLAQAIEANREELVGKRERWNWIEDIDKFTAEQVRAHIVARNAQGGNGTAEFGLKIEVKVCQNGLHCTLPNKSKWKLRHTTHVEARAKLAAEALDMARREGAKMLHQYTLFGGVPIGARELDAFCREVIGYDAKAEKNSAQAEARATAIRNAYTAAPGARAGTLLGLVQATTYHTTHEIDVKIGGSNASRFPDTFTTEQRVDSAREYSLSYGTGAALNHDALNWVRNFYVEGLTA